MVTPFSIPNSTTQMLDVGLSPDEGFEEVLEDSDDEPVVKTRIFFYSNEEPDIEAMGMHFSPLLLLLFLLLLSFLCASPYLPCMLSYQAATNAPEEPKVVAVFAEPTAPILANLGNSPFSSFYPSSFLSL